MSNETPIQLLFYLSPNLTSVLLLGSKDLHAFVSLLSFCLHSGFICCKKNIKIQVHFRNNIRSCYKTLATVSFPYSSKGTGFKVLVEKRVARIGVKRTNFHQTSCLSPNLSSFRKLNWKSYPCPHSNWSI